MSSFQSRCRFISVAIARKVAPSTTSLSPGATSSRACPSFSLITTSALPPCRGSRPRPSRRSTSRARRAGVDRVVVRVAVAVRIGATVLLGVRRRVTRLARTRILRVGDAVAVVVGSGSRPRPGSRPCPRADRGIGRRRPGSVVIAIPSGNRSSWDRPTAPPSGRGMRRRRPARRRRRDRAAGNRSSSDHSTGRRGRSGTRPPCRAPRRRRCRAPGSRRCLRAVAIFRELGALIDVVGDAVVVHVVVARRPADRGDDPNVRHADGVGEADVHAADRVRVVEVAELDPSARETSTGVSFALPGDRGRRGPRASPERAVQRHLPPLAPGGIDLEDVGRSVKPNVHGMVSPNGYARPSAAPSARCSRGSPAPRRPAACTPPATAPPRSSTLARKLEDHRSGSSPS